MAFLYVRNAAIGLLAVMLALALLRRHYNHPRRAATRTVRKLTSSVSRTAPISLTGARSPGWSIESPDQYHYYPIGKSGPSEFTATVSSGFERSREGAGTAAIHIRQRLSLESNPDWRRVLALQTVPADRSRPLESQLSALAEDEALELLRSALPHRNIHLGWRLETFNSWRADLTLAGLSVTDSGAQKWLILATVLWDDGDWRLLLTDDGPEATYTLVDSFGRLDVDFSEHFDLEHLT